METAGDQNGFGDLALFHGALHLFIEDGFTLMGEIIELKPGREKLVHLFAEGLGHNIARRFRCVRRKAYGGRCFILTRGITFTVLRTPDSVHRRFEAADKARNLDFIPFGKQLLPLGAVEFQMQKFTQKLTVPIKGQECLLLRLLG